MEKVVIKKIEIIEETEDLSPNPVLRKGKKKVFKPGHKILALGEIADLYLKAKKAKLLKDGKDFNTKKED